MVSRIAEGVAGHTVRAVDRPTSHAEIQRSMQLTGLLCPMGSMAAHCRGHQICATLKLRIRTTRHMPLVNRAIMKPDGWQQLWLATRRVSGSNDDRS